MMQMSMVTTGAGSFITPTSKRAISMALSVPEQFEPYVPDYDGGGFDIKPTGVEYEHSEAHSGREGLFLKFNR
jgi:hypothetical protein